MRENMAVGGLGYLNFPRCECVYAWCTLIDYVLRPSFRLWIQHNPNLDKEMNFINFPVKKARMLICQENTATNKIAALLSAAC